MPYVKIWIHLIWSTKNREPYLSKEIRRKLFEHITEYAQDKGIFSDSINGIEDHIHILISLKTNQTISKVVQLIKGESSHWINKNHITGCKFSWQEEYIAISVGYSEVCRVREYIKNQEEHHRKKSFLEEYNECIKQYGFQSANN